MTTLKEILKKEKTIFFPVVYDGLTARIVEMNGFEIVWIGGLNVAASNFALPDMGLLTLTEFLERARTIVRAVNIPVICDVETGFGGVNNVRRMVMEFEAAGVSGVQMEDQTFPCRCGSFTGTAVIPVEEYVPKLRAAVEARKSKDFLIVARTDCKPTLGMDEVIRRLNIYADNGADLATAGSPFTLEEYKRVVKEVKIPIKANCSIIDQIGLPFKQWEDTGVKMVGYMVVPLYFSIKAIEKSVQALKNGTIGDMISERASHEDRDRILKMDEWRKWAEQ
ncbi:MAG: isocitrate lyase/PEP mutase family protein [Betaproteobacteria bacterium]|nr:isocitrate lyase/PEP mutase family protein [Betaproteobacteria bacterium]